MTEAMPPDGRVAVVTGANYGIGASTSRAPAARNADPGAASGSA